MRSALAFTDHILVSTVDNSEVSLIGLAGQAGPVVLFLHANGFHVKCYVPLVSDRPHVIIPPAMKPRIARYMYLSCTGTANSQRRISVLGP